MLDFRLLTLDQKRQIKNFPRSLFLYSQMLFNTDIRQNFTIEKVSLEKQN